MTYLLGMHFKKLLSKITEENAAGKQYWKRPVSAVIITSSICQLVQRCAGIETTKLFSGVSFK